MADWKNILLDNDQQLTDEELLKYLDDKTSDVEKYAIEKQILENPFESDAIEGLQQINNTERVKKNVHQLNQKLHQHLHSKNQTLKKRKIKDFQWIILTVLVLLFICIISFFLIQMQTQ